MRLHLRRRPRRGYVIAAVVVLVVVGGLGTWLLTRSSPAVAQTATMTVTSGTFQQTVTATGTLEPARQADLSFAVSGRVTSVLVEAGDKVEKGQQLARVDRVSLAAALTSAQAQLDAAQSAADDDSAESSAQIASDDADVAAAEADVSQARDDLRAATLRATFSGTVAAVDVAVGDQVGSGSGSDSGSGSGAGAGSTPAASSDPSSNADTSTAQVTVISPKTYLVDATVSASDVKSLKKGMQATVTPTGATTPVYGTVQDIGLVAETSSSGAATFPVTIAVTGRQTSLYAGTSADVSIVVKQVPDVLTVPSLALHTSGGTTYVEKVVGGKTVRATVRLGETYGASTEVTSGLKSGDKVQITTPGALSRNGGTRRGKQQGELPAIPGGGGFGGPPGAGTDQFQSGPK